MLTLPSLTSRTPACPPSATSSSSTAAPSLALHQDTPAISKRRRSRNRQSKSAAQECLFLFKLCIEIGFHQHPPTIIYEDCEAAVALSKKTRFRKRSKHIAHRCHFIAERQDPQVGDLKIIHRRRTKMLADIFASSRAAPTFIAFRDHILGHNPRSWLMTTSNHSLICEGAWTHHPSLRISGAPCLSHSI